VWDGIDAYDEKYMSYNSEGELHMGKKISKKYDAVFIRDNEFLIERGIKLPETYGFSFSDTKFVEGATQFDFDNYSNSLINSNKLEAAVIDFDRAYLNGSSHYYQDGISLPLIINRLFPIAFCIICCNCTSDSRFQLNVTRHNVSENHDDVNAWLTSTGKHLQKKMTEHFLSSLKALNLDIDIKELMRNIAVNHTDYFSITALKQLKEIIGT
jgi:hypothetical protein